MSSFSTALAVTGGVLLVFMFCGIVGFAVHESSTAKKQRRAFVAQRSESASNRAASEVMAARSAFAAVVQEYEQALAGATQTIDVTAGSAGGAGPRSGATSTFADLAEGPPSNGVAELERRKDEARNRLIAAQQRWEAVRPTAGPSSEIELWSGSGVLRGWQFGPVGFERAFIRCEHVVDPACWASWEVKRMRFGFALALERQNLALFAAAVPIDRMTEILGRAMGGFEVAFRPGFSPARWWRRTRRMPEARRATYSLLTPTSPDYAVDDATRATVRNAIEAELGAPIDSVDSFGDVDGVLSVMAAGPTLAIGLWGGRTPAAELLASSPHTAWYDTESADTPA